MALFSSGPPNYRSLRTQPELELHYRHILEELGMKRGLLGEIFKRARLEIQDPALLRRLIVDLIDKSIGPPCKPM